MIQHLVASLCQESLENINFCHRSHLYSAPPFGFHSLLFPLHVSLDDQELALEPHISCPLLRDLAHYQDNAKAFS